VPSMSLQAVPYPQLSRGGHRCDHQDAIYLVSRQLAFATSATIAPIAKAVERKTFVNHKLEYFLDGQSA
jgi:hypothetical protein